MGLHLFARFTPRFVKLDAALVRRIDASASRRPIVESVMRLARGMGVTVIATGIETRGEIQALAALGLRHIQSDWIAQPSPAPATFRLAHRAARPLLPSPCGRGLRRLGSRSFSAAQVGAG